MSDFAADTRVDSVGESTSIRAAFDCAITLKHERHPVRVYRARRGATRRIRSSVCDNAVVFRAAGTPRPVSASSVCDCRCSAASGAPAAGAPSLARDPPSVGRLRRRQSVLAAARGAVLVRQGSTQRRPRQRVRLRGGADGQQESRPDDRHGRGPLLGPADRLEEEESTESCAAETVDRHQGCFR